MAKRPKKLPNRPPKEQWHKLPRTAGEAKRKKAPYWFKRDKKGHPIPCENGHINLRTSSGECVECKKARNARDRYKRWHESEKGKKYFRDREDAGLARGSVPGYRAGYPKRVPPWLTAEDVLALKNVRSSRPEGMETDHIIDPNHILHGNLISGLETAQNLQYLTRSESQKKGSHLPDPKNRKVKASRPLTMDEMRLFVRRGMAVWSKDIAKNGNVNWKLYRREANGNITYLGDEPEPIRAAAE